MKTLNTRISTLFGIILLAAIMVFIFTACPDDPGSNTPPIPSALQGTAWENLSGDTITFTEKGVIINGQTYILKDRQTSSDGIILFFGNEKTNSITYQSDTITVNFGFIYNDWFKTKSKAPKAPEKNEIPAAMQNTSWQNQYGDIVSFSKTTVTIELASGFNRTYQLFDSKLLYEYMLENFPTLIDTYLSEYRNGFAYIYILFKVSEAAEVGYESKEGTWPGEAIYDGFTMCGIGYTLNNPDKEDFTLLSVPMWHLLPFYDIYNDATRYWEKINP